MNLKNCFLAFAIITILLAFMGYLIFAGFVVPVFAECDSIGQYYESSSINMSLGEWIFGNMLAAIIIFVFLAAMGRNNKDEQSDCMMGFILTVL